MTVVADGGTELAVLPRSQRAASARSWGPAGPRFDPVQRLLRAAGPESCPHANACLTCPVFVSGPEFLPELREQRHRTLTLIEVSTGKGQTRVTEMNQQVLTNWPAHHL